MRIIFIGPPGVGKGTQSQKLVDYLHIPHISTGDMLREAIRDQTQIGKIAAEHMDNGQLAPDPVVVQLVGERLDLDDCRNGCLLDGFPRTLGQAKSLDQFLHVHGKDLDLVLNLEVDQEELFKRLLSRSQIEGREDDTPETIRNRMNIYRDQTEPLLDYYDEMKVLRRIDGMGSPEEVFSRIKSLIDELQPVHPSS
ncbi:MAG: adenylate kinase [Pirellulales bacterium]